MSRRQIAPGRWEDEGPSGVFRSVSNAFGSGVFVNSDRPSTPTQGERSVRPGAASRELCNEYMPIAKERCALWAHHAMRFHMTADGLAKRKDRQRAKDARRRAA